MGSHKFWMNRHESKANKAGKILLIIAGFIVLAFLFGYGFMLLWNVTMAEIFGLPVITYWQAIGLFLLAKLIFGFGGGKHSTHSKHNRKRNRHHNSKHSKKHLDESGYASVDEFQPATSMSFKEFWQEEGKEAYEAFVAARKNDPENQANASEE